MLLPIGKRISKLREKKGITQGQLATRLHISRDTVSKWENEPDRSIPSRYIISLSRFFSVSSDYLLGLSEEPSKKVELQEIYKMTGLTLTALQALQYFRLHGPLTGPKATIAENCNALSRVISSIPFLETIAWLMEIENNDDSIAFEMSSKYEAPYYRCDMSPSAYFNCQALHLINLIRRIREGDNGNERHKEIMDYFTDEEIKPDLNSKRNKKKSTDDV